MRRVEIAWLRRNGDVELATQVIPAQSLFEDCFTAFAHGTLIQTANGPVAVEDVLPGDHVMTKEHGPLPVLWRGSLACVQTGKDRCRSLTRIMADGFGIGRPVRDLLVGPAARVLHQARHAGGSHIGAQALVPAAALQDGAVAVPVTPPGAVHLYHLALPMHATMRAGGLDMESYHPGVSLRSSLSQRQLAQFLALFPHIDQPGDFGPLAYPRLAGLEMDSAPAA